MPKTIHVLALTLMLGGLVSSTFSPSAKAHDDDDDDNFCAKFSRKLEKKARQGKSFGINDRKLDFYRSSCLRQGGNRFYSPGNYSSNNGNGYTYNRSSTTTSPNGTGYSRSSQSTYSSGTNNGGSSSQQRTYQTNNSYDPYDNYDNDDRNSSVNVATPNSQVQIQNGAVRIRTPGTGINLGF